MDARPDRHIRPSPATGGHTVAAARATAAPVAADASATLAPEPTQRAGSTSPASDTIPTLGALAALVAGAGAAGGLTPNRVRPWRDD